MLVLAQPSSQWIPSSQWLISSWAAAFALPIGQRACSGRIHNVMKLALPGHILISNNTLFVISEETKSRVPHEFNESLLPNNPLSKHPFKLLVAYFHCREYSWIWVLRLSIIIRFLPTIVNHILSCWWKDCIQGKVAAATTHRRLGTSFAAGSLAAINDTAQPRVVHFDHLIYGSGNSIVIEEWGGIMAIRTTIAISLLLAAPKLSHLPAAVLLTGDCSILDWHHGHTDDWCNHRKYWFIIPRPLPWE